MSLRKYYRTILMKMKLKILEKMPQKQKEWFSSTGASMKENMLQTAVDISLAFKGKIKMSVLLWKNLKMLLDRKT
jgi:hypothetical protein